MRRYFFFLPELVLDEVVELVVLEVLDVGAVGFELTAAVAFAGGSVPTGCAWQGGTPGDFAAWRPAYVATNWATSLASSPTTTFCGMIAPEKPPFSIAYSTRSTGRSQRTLKLGPLVTSADRTFDAEP